MALPDLLTALRAQAAERRAEELERGRAEAARIRAEADAALERRRTDFVVRTREDEQAVARRALARAQADAAGSVLAARDRLLGRVREALEGRIADSDDDADLHGAMTDELGPALARLPSGPVVVRVSAGLERALREHLPDREGVVVEVARDMGPGFKALAPEQGVEIDATLETRLEYVWPRLAVAVLREVGG